LGLFAALTIVIVAMLLVAEFLQDRRGDATPYRGHRDRERLRLGWCA